MGLGRTAASLQGARRASSEVTKASTRKDPALRGLWIKVVIQASKDACSVNTKSRASVYRWMTSSAFREVCDYAGLDQAVIRQALELLLKTSETMPSVMVRKAQGLFESDLKKRAKHLANA